MTPRAKKGQAIRPRTPGTSKKTSKQTQNLPESSGCDQTSILNLITSSPRGAQIRNPVRGG